MASSGRYRSNVFNFLSRQSMRLQDQASQTWRQAKMAAVWGAQILLYPLYVGFQATRLVGKQLRQTARQVLPKLRAVAQTIAPPVAYSGAEPGPFLFADTPIQRSLQALNNFALLLPTDRLALQLDPQEPDAPGVWVVVGGSAIASSPAFSSLALSPSASSELLPQKTVKLEIVGSPTQLALTGLALSAKLQASEQPGVIQIQGIASLLNSHRLVLVDVQNQLLDVLSLEQQVFLQRRIAGDVASYWRQQRVLAESQPWVDRFLPLPQARTLALPPIRAFWQLMTWMQTSSVAIATNLFQESKLLAPSPLPHSVSSIVSSIPAANGIPALRSAAPWKTGSELAENLSRWFRDRLHVKAASSALIKASPTEVQAHSISSDLISFNPLHPPQTFSERMAQWGRWLRRSPILSHSTDLISHSTPSTSPPVEHLPQELPSTPFKLMQRSPTLPPVQKHESQISRSVPRGSVPSPAPLSMKTASSRMAVNPGMTSKSGETGETQLVSAAAAEIAIDQSAEQAELIAQPSWIEAEVRLVAYEKHPLEQLLEWIDRGMCWIEDRVVGIWSWLRDRWSA